jgi:hypothetical protein
MLFEDMLEELGYRPYADGAVTRAGARMLRLMELFFCSAGGGLCIRGGAELVTFDFEFDGSSSQAGAFSTCSDARFA